MNLKAYEIKYTAKVLMARERVKSCEQVRAMSASHAITELLTVIPKEHTNIEVTNVNELIG